MFEARPNETSNRPKELKALVYNCTKAKIVAYTATFQEAETWATRLNNLPTNPNSGTASAYQEKPKAEGLIALFE